MQCEIRQLSAAVDDPLQSFVERPSFVADNSAFFYETGSVRSCRGIIERNDFAASVCTIGISLDDILARAVSKFYQMRRGSVRRL